MKQYKFNFILFLISIILISFYGCRNEKEQEKVLITVTDDLGNKISFKEEPAKIISTAPNLTEIIYLLGLGDKLAGVSAFCNYPEDAKNKEVIGDLLSINIERIVKIKPDLVIITVEGNTKDSYNKLKELGIKVLVTNPRNLEGINKTIKTVAEIFGREKLADSILQDYNKRLRTVEENLKNKEKSSAMFLVASAPIMLAGTNTFIDEILKKSGFINIAENTPVPYPIYSREEILKKNPDYIIVPSEKEFKREELLSYYKEWKKVNAVKNEKIITVDPDIFLRPGPRYINAIEILHQYLQDKKN